jgi:hypothetical protein
MKKKFIVILLLILAIILICGIIISKNNKDNSSSLANTTEDENSVKTVYGLSSNETVDTNTNGENTGVYIGQMGNYIFITTKIDLNLSKEEKASALIETIGNYIGYKITVNSITAEDSKIKIDFSNTSAPFETDESYIGQGSEINPIYSKKGIASYVFDSIYETFNFQFGSDTEIYFSVDGENILLPDSNIEIDSNVAYVPTSIN